MLFVSSFSSYGIIDRVIHYRAVVAPASPKRECVVCTKVREVARQERGSSNRHETITCSVCNIHHKDHN